MATTYQQFYTQYDEAIRAGADAAMHAGLAKMGELLPYTLIPVVIVCGVLVATGQMGMRLFTSYGWRVVLLVWLTLGAAYVPYVRDMVVDTIPNEIASTLHGGVENRITVAEQFDVLETASGHFVSLVLAQATGPFQIGNRVSAWFARGCMKFFIEIIFYMWIAVRMLTYLVVAMAAFMLILIPFESTRGWFLAMVGKMVGLTVWQLAISILLKIVLAGSMVYLRGVLTGGAGMSIEEQIDTCWSIAGWFLGCGVLTIAIPTVCAGFGANIAGGAGIALGAMATGATNAIRAGNAMSRAAHTVRRANRVK